MTAIDTLTATMQTAVFRVEEPLSLPGYKGSTFRGALGHAFKQVSCALRRESCATCLVKQRCAYSVCFETPVPESAEIMRKYPSAPHPFILEPPADERYQFEPGEELMVRLWLVGNTTAYLPYFIYAFDEMGKRGLGRDRRKVTLCRVETEDGAGLRQLYHEDNESITGTAACIDDGTIAERMDELRNVPLRVSFETPIRIKSKNRLTDSCDMKVLAPSLVRRLHTLTYFFCAGKWTKDIGALLDAAETVETLDSQVHWMDWNRYSSRQETTMQLGGFIGEATYSAVPEPLLRYLCWGEALHIGKGSAFGLGKYKMMRAT
ncbi:MAG: CRISPR system precrRNA processing endoribonuclease RAMP protein Cas6 [Candidatus Hydrogenedentes bacterium]|nr:CRISPR system precrRNA processing endoribonuclease RAMP protein Cas6 [Candidatus Hydrogenedentota bacterium]